MTIYVIERLGDDLYQLGMSLNKEVAEKECKKINAELPNYFSKAFVSTYELNNKYTEFD